VSTGYQTLFNTLNFNRDWQDLQKLDEDDLLLIFEKETKLFNKKEWNKTFKKMCTSQHMINKIKKAVP